jgi:hypothetical protein
MDDATACYDWGIPHTSYSYSCHNVSVSALCTAAKHGSPRTQDKDEDEDKENHTASSSYSQQIYSIHHYIGIE